MLIKEIDENEDLTYKIFIDKGLKLINKVHVIIMQYDSIINNNEKLFEKIKLSIKEINIKKETYKKTEIDDVFKNLYIDDNNDLIKKIANKLLILDIYLNNYLKKFKNNIHYTYLFIKEINKNYKYDSESDIKYEKQVKEIDVLISFYKEIKLNDNFDDIFEHVYNISNIYILIKKIIINVNILIMLGELLKVENKQLKTIYKNL
jgi:hypothetical protein